ncbi:hypothetical protein ATCM_12595 [Stenotrophomonas sp. ATCM1_4]|uniref:hypothetical protein n=1 Tax=Stenotrophomonas sp. ATCM1_4 TaxID=2259330 RepID=UPI001051F3F1|nr:hypothetical protein [Stenotrophomonas sp. ATCM1_4]TDB28426.1 hypothetical protein ATCM_12595 [Stenotrophomonas sp. ATCM1_4]
MADKPARKPKKGRSAEWLEGALKRFSDEDLQSELKRRYMASPHAPFVMPERKPQTRVEWLRERVKEHEETLEALRETRLPPGPAVAIKQARIASLTKILARNRKYLALAEADAAGPAEVPEARKRP